MLIKFPNTHYPPIEISPHTPLAEVLTILNSPVLFGCRTGICGTCAVRVKGLITAPSPDELEILQAIAPHSSDVRLACQIDLIAELEIFSLK